jgi:plastocyanin
MLGAALLVLAQAVLPGPAPTEAADVRGQVVLNGPAPASSKVRITIDQYVCGTEKDAADLLVEPAGGIQNAVVWIENPPPGASGSPPVGAPQMDQKGCVFTPRVVVVPAGGSVEFLNSDRLLHNLHSAPKANSPFNRTQPKGRTIAVQFAKPEIVRLDCDLHSWMRGWIVVADHPYYAVTDANGAFAFAGVPPGRYTLKVWQERLGIGSRAVTVGSEGVVRVTLELPAK